LPTRSVAEHIPGDATSVDIVLSCPSLPPVRRTLTGPAVQNLATVINARSVATPGPSLCPAGDGKMSDQLTFSTPQHRIIVTAWALGCEGVKVAVDGKDQPTLNGPRTIDQAVIDALGLPPRYLFGG
jgi:hypothetical protein